MSVCQMCNGSRTMKRFEAHGEVFVACPSCGGRGRSKDKITAYYVLWFNRSQPRLEMHAAHCHHELFSKSPQFENIGADSCDDLQERAREIAGGSKPYAVLIEDCLL